MLDLIRDLSPSDVLSLMEYENLKQQLNLYSHSERAVFQVPLTLPWASVWFLTRYHRKHVFLTKKLPSWKRFRLFLANNIRKVKWRWHFAKEPRALPLVRVKTKNIAAYPHVCPPELNAWIALYRNSLIRAFQGALQSHRGQRQFANYSRLARLGYTLLVDSGYHAAPNDKGGGYSLRLIEDQRAVHIEVLQKSMYIRTFFGLVSIFAQLKKLAYRVGKSHDNEMLTTVILRPWNEGRLDGNLQFLCKSQKPSGDVSDRTVHACPGYPLAGIGKWLSWRIRQTFAEQPLALVGHLVKNAQEVVDRISQLTPVADHYWIRMDLKDFHLTGDCDTLTSLAWRHEGDELVRDVTRFLLTHQYLTSRHADYTYQVVEGVGQGLPPAGDLADLAFFNAVERHFVACEETRRLHGVAAYFRFRDDILMVASRREGTAAIVNGMFDRQSCFKIVVEEVSRQNTIEFLNIQIEKTPTAYITRPWRKEGSADIILGTDSAHPTAVHNSWPRALAKTLVNLANTPREKVEALSVFNARLARNYHTQITSQMLSSHQEPVPLVHGAAAWWHTYGFHPILQRPLNSALSRVQNSW